MTFCSRSSVTCKRFLHADGYLRRTNVSNSQLPALPPTFTATDLYHVWPKHIHSGEITPGKEKGSGEGSLQHGTKTTGYIYGYFQNTIGGIVSSITSLKITSMPYLSKSREKDKNNKNKTLNSTKLKGSTDRDQVLKKYQASARLDIVERTATEEKEKPEADSVVNYKRSYFIHRKEIEKTTRSLVLNLKYAESEPSIIERTNKLIAHLLEYPDERNIADEENAIRVLKDLKRSCRQGVKEILSKALVLMGHVGPTKGSDGVRVLSLDGGGIKGICTIEMMQRIENEYNRQLRVHGITKRKSIHEMFDYVCGTSTGSLLASMVFLFKVPLIRCRELYIDLGKKMFERNKLAKIKSTVVSSSMYDEKLWEEILSSHFEDRQLMEFGAMDDIPKLAGISCITNVPIPTRFIFRTYNLPPGTVSRYPGSCKYRAQEMIRASSAAPTYYTGKTLEKFVHVDGGLMSNNPTGVAIHECNILWPHKDISCLISLGTGRYLQRLKLEQNQNADRTTVKPGAFDSMKQALSVMRQSATDTEEIHDVLSDVMPGRVYFRFNPYLERDIGLDDVDSNSLQDLDAATVKYMGTVDGRIVRAVGQLMTEKKTPLYLDVMD